MLRGCLGVNKGFSNKQRHVTTHNGSQWHSCNGSHPKWEKTDSESVSKYTIITGNMPLKNILFFDINSLLDSAFLCVQLNHAPLS